MLFYLLIAPCLFCFFWKVKKQKNKSLVSVSLTCNLFGSILYRALQRELDMEQLLRYLLTPVPLSISTWVKQCRKHQSWNCFKTLKQFQPPSTFSSLVDHLLRQVCKQRGMEIHLFFDKSLMNITIDLKFIFIIDAFREYNSHLQDIKS